MKPPSKNVANAAFTFVEVMIAAGIVALIAAFSFGALTQLNQYATLNRLYTLAGAVARGQIDQIENATPFNPQLKDQTTGNLQIPPILTVGTKTQNDVPLYTDPVSGQTIETATITTKISDTGSLNTYAATVTVQFQYRNTTYQVVLNTLRTSDS